MDQSVTIDGQRVLLNGEPVAEALGDFSVRVLAEAIVLHTQMQKELGGENGAFPVVHWLGHAETVVRLGVTPEEPTLATGWFGRRESLVKLRHGCQQGGQEKLLGLPAPADLIIKAREYYPDNEGLLRMYADCRGYSCGQVAEAIDHAKRL